MRLDGDYRAGQLNRAPIPARAAPRAAPRASDGGPCGYGWRALTVTGDFTRKCARRFFAQHASLDCRACHKPAFQRGAVMPLLRNRRPERSWLDLDASCAACHDDPHRGALGADCRRCHGAAAWKPAAGFDHARTGFSLAGKHVRLLTALVVLIRDLFISEREPKGYLAFISLLGIGLAIAESLALWGGQEGAFDDTLMLDNFTLYFSLVFLIAAALTILTSIQYLRLTGIHEGEFYALVLFATVGMMIMAAANDLLVFFLGLETMSIAVYVLTGMWRASDRSIASTSNILSG